MIAESFAEKFQFAAAYFRSIKMSRTYKQMPAVFNKLNKFRANNILLYIVF